MHTRILLIVALFSGVLALTSVVLFAATKMAHTSTVPPPAASMVMEASSTAPIATSTSVQGGDTKIPEKKSAFKSPATTVTTDCVRAGRQDFSCYEEYYTQLVAASGVAATFTDLKERYESTPSVKGNCHQITHAIGHAGAALAGGVGAAFALGDAMCWSGYYHGVMESIIKGIGVDALPEKMNDICSDVLGKSSYSFSYYNCVHGLGHGVMLIYNNDLFASLGACTDLSGAWERSSCAGGVYMENIMIESRGVASKFLKKEDPLYPCNASPTEYKTPCYLMQTSHMLTAAGDDFAKVFALCGTTEEAYRATCYQSLGRDASGRTVSDAVRTKASCMLGTDTFARENCVIGAVKDFVSYFHSDVQAKAFCLSLTPELEKVCSTTMQSYYATF